MLKITSGWGLVTRETNHMMKWSEFSALSPDFYGRIKDWKLSAITWPKIWSVIPMS